jgi:zinc resistance-associated protein
MRKLTVIMVALVLMGFMALPAIAQRGGNPGLSGNGSGGFGRCPWYGAGNSSLTAEQRAELDRLHQGFREETAGIRNELQAKRQQLRDLMRNSNPDPEKARALRQEISALETQMDQKHLEYQLEARKIAPDTLLGCGYGYGGHHGRGGGMMGGGYGPGSCWY